MPNALIAPPFAADPPVKVNVNARTLGLIIGILAIIRAVFALLGLLAVFGACSVAGVSIAGCGFPILWLLGDLVVIVGLVAAAIGGFRMYNLDRSGKELTIYGIALLAIGELVYLLGNIVFYSGALAVLGGLGVGVIVAFIIWLAIYFCIYYLVVISRFPGEAPLAPGAIGGYRTPPPPPPPPPA